ncbi:hypothetical protein MPR_0715 [Myroides profundi]|nr:hypothetical protein MPR_0715 [Myroides profundi]
MICFTINQISPINFVKNIKNNFTKKSQLQKIAKHIASLQAKKNEE